MLVLKDITKSFDDRLILDKITLILGKHEVLGLIGDNGSGKTTLLKIITGEVMADTGVVAAFGEAIGYLPQNPELKEESISAFLSRKLYDTAQQYKLDLALHEVGLDTVSKETSCTDLSGGQKTRLNLASLLLHDPSPSILILDEPTNNLDIESLEWLQVFVKKFKGSIILTSHDRFFLDEVVHKIVELKNGKIRIFGGSFSFYEEQLELEREAYEKKYSAQQKRIAQIKEDIGEIEEKARGGEKRFLSSSPYQRRKIAKGAKTAVVRKEKLKKLLESEEFLQKPERRKNYNFGFSGQSPAGKLIVEVKDLFKSYKGFSVLSNISFSVRGGDRIWLQGSNGSGKSTLLKVLAGFEQSDSGLVRWGKEIKPGYFSQDFDMLKPEHTGIQELKSPQIDETSCYTAASYLHLKEEDLRKRIKHLSRGQQAKLAIVKLLLSNFNFLILDEPTNHLEIEARKEIEDALADYDGALIVASHDRYFVEAIEVDRVIGL